MAIGVLLMGASGMGKSASMRNCQRGFSMINTIGKPLPFRNTGIRTIQTDDTDRIIGIIQSAQAASIVIDDAGYIISNFYMKNKAPLTAKMNDKFAVYDSLATGFWNILETIKMMPPEKIVYVIMHEDLSDTGKIKPKTIGQMLDKTVCIEGFFSIVLRAEKLEGKYIFRTNTSGADVTKSPMGMFPEIIDNDLLFVDQTIRAYYGLKTNQEEKK